MRKVLVIGTEYYFNLYGIGLNDYANRNNLIIDYFDIGGGRDNNFYQFCI